MCDDCGGTCGTRRAGLRRAVRGGGQDVDELGPSPQEALHQVIEPIHRALRTLNAVPLLGARAYLVPGSNNGTAQSGMVSASPGRLGGLSIAETTGNTGAVVRLRDGADLSGDPIARWNLTANESVREWFLPHGIAWTYGLFVEVVSGSVEVVLYLGRDR